MPRNRRWEGRAYRKLSPSQAARVPRIEHKKTIALPRVKGRTAAEIAQMPIQEFNRMGESDMRLAVSTMVSVANKRLRRFEKKGVTSPAVRRAMESGGRFSVKGKTLNELRSEFMRVKGFLESATSTVSGWNVTKKGVIDELARRGVKLSDETYDDFWESYEKLKELSPEVSNQMLRYDVMKTVGELVESGKTPDEIAVDLQNEIANIYEARESWDNDDGRSVSSFFEL